MSACYCFYRYTGSDKDTTLNKFLREHDDSHAVVLLDEADKLEDDCWIALMAIFERGEWKDQPTTCLMI